MATNPKSRPSHGFRDDRDVPLRIAPHSVLFGQLWDRTPWRVWVRWVPLIAFGLFVLWRFIVDPSPPTSQQLVPAVIGGALTFAVFLFLSLHRRHAPGQSPLAAYLAAHRLCGACGYDLHTVAPEADGCVVCPECGGAWHSDRFVMEDEDPRQSSTLAALAARGHSIGGPNSHDDRGVPMRQAWRWYPHWMIDGPASTVELESATRRLMQRFHARVLPIAALLWAGVLATIILTADEPDTFAIVASTVVTFLITAIVCFALSRIRRDRVSLREVRRMGLCPNCGHALPTDAPPTFDGCTVCTHCKLAWNLSGPDGRAARRAPGVGAAASVAGATTSPRDPAASAPFRPVA